MFLHHIIRHSQPKEPFDSYYFTSQQQSHMWHIEGYILDLMHAFSTIP